MQVIFDRKKKLIFIVIVICLVFLLFVIYLFSTKGNKTLNQQISPDSTATLILQTINETTGVSDVKDFLFEKSVTLIISLSKLEKTYFLDPIFVDLKADLVRMVQNDIAPLGANINIRNTRTIVNSDSLSGVVYVIVENDIQERVNLTLTYSKNPQGEWKLVDYKRSTPKLLKLDDRSIE